MSDKTITLTVVIGIIILTISSMFVYGANGKDVTLQALTGLFGFVSGAVVSLNRKDTTVAKSETVQGDVNNG